MIESSMTGPRTTVSGNRPLIFDMRHFALDDGPGIRTTVFTKGCPLACIWCHNPESRSSQCEIAFHGKLCIACGDCEKICPEKAVDLEFPGRILRDRCNACGQCVQECPATALRMVGESYSEDALAEILLRDRIFYETSKGGVTFSGGEPTLHMNYLREVMKQLKAEDVHIAIETAGVFDYAKFEKKLLPYIDLIYYDLKIMDPRQHKRFIGVSNQQILYNFNYLSRFGNLKIVPRTPLVPGITATKTNLIQIADFLKNRECAALELLPYNPGGLAKRAALGISAPAELPSVMMGKREERKYRAYLDQQDRICVTRRTVAP